VNSRLAARIEKADALDTVEDEHGVHVGRLQQDDLAPGSSMRTASMPLQQAKPGAAAILFGDESVGNQGNGVKKRHEFGHQLTGHHPKQDYNETGSF